MSVLTNVVRSNFQIYPKHSYTLIFSLFAELNYDPAILVEVFKVQFLGDFLGLSLTFRFIVEKSPIGPFLNQSNSFCHPGFSIQFQPTCVKVDMLGNPGLYAFKTILNFSVHSCWSCLGLGKSFIIIFNSVGFLVSILVQLSYLAR